ncbi:MAG TPA: hypothetical protein VFS24_02325 [Steroidobacteraceae bacterium]|nr:hypothetical protein [Steroidobacteraceae bacterium]
MRSLGDLARLATADLKDVASITRMVREFFEGEVVRVKSWFELTNPMLGICPASDDPTQSLQAAAVCYSCLQAIDWMYEESRKW